MSIDADSLETLVVESVHRAVDTQSLGAAWFDDEDRSESASLAAQLDALDLRRREAAGSYAAGTLPLAALEQAVAAIEDEAEAVRRRLATMSSWNPMRRYARQPGLLRDRWDELGLDARRALMSAVVEKVVISRAHPGSPARFDPGRVEICWRA